MFPLVEIEMEGLLILERSNKAKPNLLLTVVFFGEMAWKPTFGSECYAAGWWKRIVVLRELLIAS